jgi:hypothetical protein
MNLPTQKTKIEPVVVEGDENEVISPEEIAESEAAWQDYLSGKDQGISLEELEQELLGENLE